VTKAFATR